MESILKLFKAVEIQNKEKEEIDDEILKLTIAKGFIFAPEVIANYSKKELLELIKKININLTPEQLNSSFHKSWQKIKDASLEQLLIEQLFHYITTYGFEYLGISGAVYIPNEELNIPEISKDIKLTVIHGYTKEEIKEKVLSLLESGIALAEETINDIVTVAKYVGVDQQNIDSIKNKEVLIALSDHLNIIPKIPVEFLRYLIFKATGKTLLIKNISTIEGIRDCENQNEIYDIFIKYKQEYGLENLATIFLRFKPVFLAFKSNDLLKPVINKLRKLAVKHHKPMPADYLNNITMIIKSGFKVNNDNLHSELKKVNTFRKIRLAYALNYRTIDSNSILYKIRNGKGYATEFSFENKEEAKRVLDIILKSISSDIRKNVEDKKIFIPENINYALPATEKQFIDTIPSGSHIIVPDDMIVGVNWYNVEGQRIDLDLSLMTSTNKFGWDAYYRNDEASILFSGDMTDASGEHGATELFYVKKHNVNTYLLLLNYYNYNPNIEVPFKIFVAKEKTDSLSKNYMVNPDNIAAELNSKTSKYQKILGLLVVTDKESKFYFIEADIGNSITSYGAEYIKQSKEYLSNFYQNTISLNNLLLKSGAIMVDNTDDCDIDLSINNLNKSTILDLVTRSK